MLGGFVWVVAAVLFPLFLSQGRWESGGVLVVSEVSAAAAGWFGLNSLEGLLAVRAGDDCVVLLG